MPSLKQFFRTFHFDADSIQFNLFKLLVYIYWVVRKVHADVEGELKRRKFKF